MQRNERIHLRSLARSSRTACGRIADTVWTTPVGQSADDSLDTFGRMNVQCPECAKSYRARLSIRERKQQQHDA